MLGGWFAYRPPPVTSDQLFTRAPSFKIVAKNRGVEPHSQIAQEHDNLWRHVFDDVIRRNTKIKIKYVVSVCRY